MPIAVLTGGVAVALVVAPKCKVNFSLVNNLVVILLTNWIYD